MQENASHMNDIVLTNSTLEHQSDACKCRNAYWSLFSRCWKLH